MENDKYWLGNSVWSATRLRLQYELTKTNFDGRILDSSISIDKDRSINVADVATGCGTWALEVAEQFPNAVVEGLDINLKETPPAAWLPSNVTFRHFDLLQDEIPEDLIGKFDVVNLQYVVVFVSDENFKEVTERLIRLLKPGGYLQWTEVNASKIHFKTASCDHNPPEAERLRLMALDVLFQPGATWDTDIADLFRSLKMHDVKTVAPEAKTSTLQPNMMNWFWILQESLPLIAAKNPAKKAAVEAIYKQLELTVKESQALQTGWDMGMTRYVGRKAT